MQGLLGDDASNDLAAELAKRQEPSDGHHWNERRTEAPEDWMPDPREADPRMLCFHTAINAEFFFSLRHFVFLPKQLQNVCQFFVFGYFL